MTDLFEEWRSRGIHKGAVFIADGVIDVESWNESDAKILFLLKEAYSTANNEFDLCELVNKWLVSRIPRKGGTWPNIAKWAYGIENTLHTGKIPPFPDREKEAASLKKIAVVNLKKSGGKKSQRKRI